MPRGDYPGAEPFLPERPSISSLREAVRSCRGCELYQEGTQAVFGAGPAHAGIVMVGEQPGDQEDKQGRPFVGPAGRLLDRAVDEAGLDPAAIYRTNAVKHFHFRSDNGKRRIHATPSGWHVAACQPWLLTELDVIHPAGVVLLGATAGRSLLGTKFRVGDLRGRRLDPGSLPCQWMVATIHPSAALRAENRDEMFDGLVRDLRVAADCLAA